MRKMAQEKKQATSLSSSLSNSSSSSSTSLNPIPNVETKDRSFYDTGGNKIDEEENIEKDNYSMDEIWNDIISSEDDTINPVYCDGFSEEVCNFSCPNLASPIWDYFPESLWMKDEYESEMFLPTSELFSAPLAD